MLAVTETLPPPVLDRIDELRQRLASVEAHLTALAATLRQTPADGYILRSARAEEKEIADCIRRLERMADQASREMVRGDTTSAVATLSAVSAILQGEFTIRLRAWSRAERDPAARQVLDTWLTQLETRPEAP